MRSNNKIIISISLLLLTLSISISVANYMLSLHATQVQLKQQTLPLSIDNIYAKISVNILEPYIVSSAMANDVFIKKWVSGNENDTSKIASYLKTLKNRHEVFVAFLVSEKTKNFYTQDGFLEKINADKKDSAWYFKFKDISEQYEINFDFNKNISNSMLMFVNFKILDKNNVPLAVTGVGQEVSYFDSMLRMFREQYNLGVYFFDKNGKLVLSEQQKIKNISDLNELTGHNEILFGRDKKTIEYKKHGDDYILVTKYASDLDLYIAVEARLDDFTNVVKKTFIFNIIVSLLITLTVTTIIIGIIRRNNSKLELMSDADALTKVLNRRSLSEKFEYVVLLSKRNRNQLSILYLDIDNFKSINDKHGHQMGDFVLNRTASVIGDCIRRTDLFGRWGGEEFLVVFVDTNIKQAHILAEQIRSALENDTQMQTSIGASVTASFGLAQYHDGDTTDSVIARADDAMYKAKKNGKNQVATSIVDIV